jgi:hypothetical protein
MFGTLGNLHLEVINKLSLAGLRKRYTFTDNDEFRKILASDLPKSQKIYWYEILMRVHLTAATAILRSRRWIDATVTSAKAENLLAFAASLRGLIESVADTNTALISVPATLTRDYSMILSALEEKADRVFIVEQLEDTLIHYSHARKIKKSQSAPDSHRAQQLRDYISILEKGGVHRVVGCYSQLCDLTHPGASSVWMWLKAESELSFEIDTSQEQAVINWFLTEYEPMFADLFAFAFNMPIVSLAVLNHFPVSEFHTPELKHWDLSGIQAWRKIPKDFFTLPLRV